MKELATTDVRRNDERARLMSHYHGRQLLVLTNDLITL